MAEHTYRAVLLPMLLTDMAGADTLKTVRMAFLHDLLEARVGDLTPGPPGKKEAEEKAMRGSSPLCRRNWKKSTAVSGRSIQQE